MQNVKLLLDGAIWNFNHEYLFRDLMYEFSLHTSKLKNLCWCVGISLLGTRVWSCVLCLLCFPSVTWDMICSLPQSDINVDLKLV